MKNICHKIAFTLLVIGGLNWGLVAIGMYLGINIDLSALLYRWPLAMMAVYLLVGIAALAVLFSHKKSCSECQAQSAA